MALTHIASSSPAQNTQMGADSPLLPGTQRAQAEVHAARSYVDRNLVVSTFQDGRFTNGGALGCGYAISHDAGLTWSRGIIPGLTELTGGPFKRATDPVAAIDHAGNIFLGTYAFTPGGSDAMAVSKSTDGGATFSAPVFAVTNDGRIFALDKNWLTVNTFPGSPTFGRLALSWTSLFYAAASNGVVVSDDGGNSWTRPQFVGAKLSQATQPLFLPDGSLAMFYWNFDGNRIEFVRSEDGGLTFALPTIVFAVQRYDDPIARGLGFAPSAAGDRQAGVVYVCWQGRTDANPGSRPCIFFSRSIDQGKTWTTPVAVNDTPDARSVFMPALAASPDGQHLTVIFYDKRNDPGAGYLVDLYLAESFDGGQTWQPNVRLSEVSSDLRAAPLTDRGYMLGDYQAIVPALDFDSPAVACWIDTRSGNPDPFAMQIRRRRGTSFATWRTLRFSATETGDASIAGPDADPDGDGIPNLAEYAHGLEPRHADPAPLHYKSGVTTTDPAGTRAALPLSYNYSPVLDDIAFSWVASDDLTLWSPIMPAEQASQAGAESTLRSFEAHFPIDVDTPSRAYRLQLNQTNRD